jgi:Uma2 family endonuclease
VGAQGGNLQPFYGDRRAHPIEEFEHAEAEEGRSYELRFGVREYWIVDAIEGHMKVLRRSRGRWAERSIKPPQVYKTPILPEFELSIEAAETGRKRN